MPDPTLRTGLELTACELDSGGTARAALSLQRSLQARADIEVCPIAQPGQPDSGPGARIARGLRRELSWLPVGLARESRRRNLDLLHCPGPVVPWRSAVPLVVTIFDALPWRHPEWLTRANVASHRLVVRRAVRRAGAVITASEHARMEISDVYGIVPERIHVVPLGIDSHFSPGEPHAEVLADLGVRRPFVLTVGTLQPRKNLESVLSAFERLVARGADLSLVVAGGAGWAARATAERIQRSPAHDRIVLTGHVDDDTLLALYRAAQCFVLPSRYEGFGMPVLEAMAAGTPVVCSDRTSLPEVAGGAALLVSPDAVEEIAGAMDRIASSQTLQEELIGRGLRRAKDFSWERCADETVAVYRAVLNDSR